MPDCIILPPGPEPLPQKGLQYLVLLSHRHSRECSLVPGLRGPAGGDGELVWECSAGHTFSWEPSLIPTPVEEPKQHLLSHTTERTWCSGARRKDPEGEWGKKGFGERKKALQSSLAHNWSVKVILLLFVNLLVEIGSHVAKEP